MSGQLPAGGAQAAEGEQQPAAAPVVVEAAALGQAIAQGVGDALNTRLGDILSQEKQGRRVDKEAAAPLQLGDVEAPPTVDSTVFNISNGVGDMPISADVARLIQKQRIVGPLSLFDDQVIYARSTEHDVLLPPAYDSKILNKAREKLDLYAKVDHLMPQHKFFPAIFKMVEAVKMILFVGKDAPAARNFLSGDACAFVRDLVIRSSDEGGFRVAREYALAKLDGWRNKVEAGVPAASNRLSTFDQALWASAITTAGARKDDVYFKAELSGDGKTAWGAAVNLLMAKQATKILKAIEEDRDFGRKVLRGDCSEGAIPPSLDFRPASLASHAGPVPRTKLNPQPQAPYDRNKRASGTKSSNGSNANIGQPFQASCLVCHSNEHRYDRCDKLPDSVKLNGNELEHSYDDAGKSKYLCRSFNRGRCDFGNSCRHSHGCARCGAKGHASATCEAPLRA